MHSSNVCLYNESWSSRHVLRTKRAPPTYTRGALCTLTPGRRVAMEVVSVRFCRPLSPPSLSLFPYVQFCLGNQPWQPCYVMRINSTTIMLDCSLDLPVLLNFLPLPLVYRSDPYKSTQKALNSSVCVTLLCSQVE